MELTPAELLTYPRGARLEEVKLVFRDLTDARLAPTLAALAGCDRFAEVRVLDISRVSCERDDYPDFGASVWWIGDDVLAALCCHLMPRLEVLVAAECDVGRGGVRAVRAASWPALRRLDLRSNLLHADEAAVLAGWSGFGRLGELDLRENTLGSDGVRALLAPALGPRVVVNEGDLGPEGAALAAGSVRFDVRRG